MVDDAAVVFEDRVVQQHEGQVVQQVANKDARKEVGRPRVIVHKVIP